MKVVYPRAKHKAISSQLALSSFGLLSLKTRFPKEEGTSNEVMKRRACIMVLCRYIGACVELYRVAKKLYSFGLIPNIAL